jgi:hypothetical protein
LKMHYQIEPVNINATKLDRMIRTIPGTDDHDQQLL